jgi:hypothetical protein
LVALRATFAVGPAVLARGDDPPDPPVPGFARPVAETVSAGRRTSHFTFQQFAWHNPTRFP